ncbi:MAG TPA: Gfo/Idh/MocA family oxidoreductase [Armatimonadota bacterium]|nr:Gfo/Idh/MocA family oxidoreductase [Armatimonadota bacterium]
MADVLKLGMVGLDTSHCAAFTALLNEEANAYHVPGARVVKAFPGGSALTTVSTGRVETITAEMRERFDMEIADSLEALAGLDGYLLESVDGRQHLAQFRVLAQFGKPVFIDKPLACSAEDATAIFALARQHGAPVMTASSLRYAAGVDGMAPADAEVFSAEAFGPMSILEDYPTYFWYGIHSAEMLFALMGAGCRAVTAHHAEHYDVLVGEWADGRLATVRGTRGAWPSFGAVALTSDGLKSAIALGTPPYYFRLLQRVVPFLQTGVSPIPDAESVEIAAFLEAAGQSLASGGMRVELPL